MKEQLLNKAGNIVEKGEIAHNEPHYVFKSGLLQRCQKASVCWKCFNLEQTVGGKVAMFNYELYFCIHKYTLSVSFV